MLVIGILLVLAGAGSTIFGIVQNNDLERQMESIFESGTANPGTVWIVVGAVALVVGIILLVVNFKKTKKD